MTKEVEVAEDTLADRMAKAFRSLKMAEIFLLERTIGNKIDDASELELTAAMAWFLSEKRQGTGKSYDDFLDEYTLEDVEAKIEAALPGK